MQNRRSVFYEQPLKLHTTIEMKEEEAAQKRERERKKLKEVAEKSKGKVARERKISAQFRAFTWPANFTSSLSLFLFSACIVMAQFPRRPTHKASAAKCLRQMSIGIYDTCYKCALSLSLCDGSKSVRIRLNGREQTFALFVPPQTIIARKKDGEINKRKGAKRSGANLSLKGDRFERAKINWTRAKKLAPLDKMGRGYGTGVCSIAHN